MAGHAHTYADLLHALGQLLDARGLSDISIIELDDGFAVCGVDLLTAAPGGQRAGRRTVLCFAFDELSRSLAGSRRTQPGRWLL